MGAPAKAARARSKITSATNHYGRADEVNHFVASRVAPRTTSAISTTTTRISIDIG
jgi:hypothetical protein